MISSTKTLATIGLVAAISVLSISDADARHRGRHHGRSNAGPAIAMGLLGGLVLGAVIANNQRQNHGYQQQGYYGNNGYHPQQQYYAPQQQYYAPQQQYYAPHPQPRGQYITEIRVDQYGQQYQVRRRCFERYPHAPSGICN